MIIKRNGEKVKFNENKIYEAIMKAMKFGSGIVREDVAYEIAYEIKERYMCGDVDASTVEGIENIVYTRLIEKGEVMTAKAYEGYRAVQKYKRENDPLINSVLGLINRTNEAVMGENSNKDADLVNTQRDLMAGELSKVIANNMIPAHILQAEQMGAIKIHK